MERSRGVLSAQWHELLRLRRAVLKAYEPDAIHDLRVASRRFRAAMNLCEVVKPNASNQELVKSVRTLTRALSGLRNIDEARLFFESHLQHDASAAAHLSCTLAALHRDEVKRVTKLLKGFGHHHFGRTVHKLATGMAAEPFTSRNAVATLACFSEAAIRLYLPILQLFVCPTVSWNRSSRHTLRIAIKKLRYFFELLSKVLDRDYAPLLEQLKEYQTILGRLNDIAEFEALLPKLKLARAERKLIKTVLLDEETLLLEEYAALVAQKPLVFTFLI